jgi:hypothetical protein
VSAFETFPDTVKWGEIPYDSGEWMARNDGLQVIACNSEKCSLATKLKELTGTEAFSTD